MQGGTAGVWTTSTGLVDAGYYLLLALQEAVYRAAVELPRADATDM